MKKINVRKLSRDERSKVRRLHKKINPPENEPIIPLKEPTVVKIVKAIILLNVILAVPTMVYFTTTSELSKSLVIFLNVMQAISLGLGIVSIYGLLKKLKWAFHTSFYLLLLNASLAAASSLLVGILYIILIGKFYKEYDYFFHPEKYKQDRKEDLRKKLKQEEIKKKIDIKSDQIFQEQFEEIKKQKRPTDTRLLLKITVAAIITLFSAIFYVYMYFNSMTNLMGFIIILQLFLMVLAIWYRGFSIKTLIILSLIPISLQLAIHLAPAQLCELTGDAIENEQKCECHGIERHNWGVYHHESYCIGQIEYCWDPEQLGSFRYRVNIPCR